MLKWEIDNNVVSSLWYKGKNIINPWGFETADSSAFFSLQKNVGWRNKKTEEQYNHTEKTYNAHVVTKMKEGAWRLDINDSIDGYVINRKIEAITLSDSYFMDFVMRFRFKKEFIKSIQIAGHVLEHKNTNIYHQYPVSSVIINGLDFTATISIEDSITPEKLEPVMYARDSGDEWIVHARMIPREWDKEVIKICTAWAGTRPLPQALSRFLLKCPKIRESLWYRGERKPFKNRFFRRLINPAAYGMVHVKKHQRLIWKVKAEIREK